MTKLNNEIFLEAVNFPTEGLTLLGKLTEAASPEAVFGKPIQQGDTTVITANTVNIGLGYGLGGFVLGRNEVEKLERDEVNGGGGGGGATSARPVAVISIRPEGVEVKPVIDVTQIGLALISAVGAIFIASKKIKKLAK
jgi:uncharacterized spore protein YtfJ